MTRLRARLAFRHHEAGSMSVELALLAPAVMLLVLLVVFAGRVTSAKSAVSNAAYSAARAASLERSSGRARSAADTAAGAIFTEASLRCTSRSTTIDTSGFGADVGQVAQVRVDVTCAVPLSDLGLPGAPGTRALEASAVSPIDRFRERS